MKICIVTGTRAEYGLLRPLMARISGVAGWQLQVVATGMHLSPDFGFTYKEIEKDGFVIDWKVDMLLSSATASGITKSMGLAMIGFADAFSALQPDLLVILGDRYEMLAVASTAVIYKIPIAHIHGGEITEGAYDDAIRHAISKMSNLHFASTRKYADRIIQMGEQPESVFDVGAIGIDNIKDLALLSSSQLQAKIGINFRKWNYLVTFHPATLSETTAEQQFQTLLDAIDKQQDSFFIFTKANADTDGKAINAMIDRYVAEHPINTVAFISMGQLNYLSAMQCMTAVVGNSSSGILEAPALHIPTINIGDRQKGRIQAASVLNCQVDTIEICRCFEQVRSVEFMNRIADAGHPYGNGRTSEQIIQHLKDWENNKRLRKIFYDLP